jgi:Spy/CpxP family protein refolding chaperone
MLKTSLKRFSLLASAIALAVTMPTVTMAKTPVKTPVKTPAPVEVKPAPAPTSKSIWEEMNLKPEQKAKIQGIRAARTRAINKELTEKQKPMFDKLRAKGSLAEALKGLNLTPAQAKTINGLVKKANDDVLGVLDKSQKDQLAAYLKQKKSDMAE